MTETTLERATFAGQVASYMGMPYQWGGGRIPEHEYGVDCSGLVIRSLTDLHWPLPRCPLPTSNGWWHCLARTDAPLVGDLSFYGTRERVVHVEIVTGFDPSTGIASTIGANGGDSTCTTLAIANARKAFVRQATTAGRKNHVGFCRLPIELLSVQPYGHTDRTSHALFAQGLGRQDDERWVG